MARRLLGVVLVWLFANVVNAAPDRSSFVILHTNDFHGRHLPIHVTQENATAQTGDPGAKQPIEFPRSGEVGGFATLATAVNQLRKQHGEDRVLLLHAGDTFSDDLLGNITQGEAVIDFMNLLKYDFMALGNHDFDYGLEKTKALQEKAQFPMRGANVIDRASGLPLFGKPDIIKELNGLRVGVIAMGYHNTPLTGNPEHVAKLRFEDGVDAARRYVSALKNEADVVLLLSHLGIKVDRVVAKQVDGIDIIVGGHSHDLIEPPEKVADTWIVQSLPDTAVLGETRMRIVNGSVQVETKNHWLWSDAWKADREMAEKIQWWRTPHEERLTEVIGIAGEPIGRQYKSESPFDNLVGRILMAQTKSDVAFLPGVGYGVSLNKGPVTREALMALLPHPSKVVSMQLTGKQITELLEKSATNQKPSDPRQGVGGLIQTAGMTWTVDLNKPQGSRVSEVRIDGAALKPEQVYKVVTHTGMLKGVHRYDTFLGGKKIMEHPQLVSDVVEAYFRQHSPVSPAPARHITLHKARE